MACTIGKALLFPVPGRGRGATSATASPPRSVGRPPNPFKRRLFTGQTCQEIADAFTTDTGKQWTQALLHYAVFEVVADVLTRTTDVEDKESDHGGRHVHQPGTPLCGNVNWKAGEGQNPVPNISKTPLAWAASG